MIAHVLSSGFIFVFYHSVCCDALEWCNREVMHSQTQFLSLRGRKCKCCLIHPSCLLFFLPCFQGRSSTFRTGSLLSCARITKVTLFLLCGWIREFSQAVLRSQVIFAVDTAEAGGGFCLWATSAHCGGVCRDQGNRYPEEMLTLMLFCMLPVWMVVFWNCSHNLLILASLIPGIFLLCACQGYQWRDGVS